MTDFLIGPFIGFCLIATGTPGPNNMINLAQGVRLGFWPALPFAIGTGFGIGSLLIAAALGLGAAIQTAPWLSAAMTVLTLAFLLYLAWRLATAGPLAATDDAPRIGFAGGFGFQWINPKTWASAMTMVALYLPQDPSTQTALAAGAIFCGVAWTTQPIWIAFGAALRRILQDRRRARVFNGAMAALLLLTTVPALLGRL